MTGLILFAHGSTVGSANDAVRLVTAEIERRCAYDLTETAFLDCAPPTLGDAVEALIAKGARRIVVVPYFLTLGIHLRRDLPALVEASQARHPGVEIEVTDPLDGHPALIEAVVERAGKAMHGGGGTASTTD